MLRKAASERDLYHMCTKTFTWRLLTGPELTEVYLNEMRRDFPAGGLKPLSMILTSEAEGTAHTWGVFDGDTLAAYLLMVRPEGCRVSQLDYFAVVPAYRAHGIGAQLLAQLPAHEGDAEAILIEAEMPEKAEDAAMAVRRLGFYARCGAWDTHYTEHLFDAWFRILVLDCPGCASLAPEAVVEGEKFRVGRSTIREAVKLLSSKGIVEVRQGSGTYVVTTVKGLSDPLNLRSVQDKNALAFDLVNVRLLLEPGIAEMAAQNATPEDIERLRRLCERVETKIHEGDRYIEDDIAFHTCIAESSKNLVVGQLIPVIDTAVMMFVNVTHKKLIDETIMTHRMITEAIANHDPIGAKAAMVMHLNFNRSYIKKVYDGEDPDDGTIGMAAYIMDKKED